MNFEQILALLVAKFSGVRKDALAQMARTFSLTATTEDEAKGLVEKLTPEQVTAFAKDYRKEVDKEVSESNKTYEANLKKKYDFKEKSQEPAPDESDTGKNKSDDEPAWAKKLREQNEALQAKLAAMDGDKIVTARKTQLSKAIEKAPKEIREQYEKDLSRMTFKDDEDYTAWLTEVTTGVNTIVEAAAVKGVTFQRPPSAGGPKPDEKPSAEVEARIKAREAETAPPAIIGLPSK